jgi:hypothetical protein
MTDLTEPSTSQRIRDGQAQSASALDKPVPELPPYSKEIVIALSIGALFIMMIINGVINVSRLKKLNIRNEN